MISPGAPGPATSGDSPVAALHLFTHLLAGVGSDTLASEFYGRLAEATCKLAQMRRAVIFLYDEDLGVVRVRGAHAMDVSTFDGMTIDIDTAPIARRALQEDRVIEFPHDEDGIPAEWVARLGVVGAMCTPISAGGRWYGVILADRGHAQPLTDAEREWLWTLGKVSALALSARSASVQQEQARQLAQRIDLARDVHEQVVQRLFGVSLALGSDAGLGRAERDRCAEEVQRALEDLRVAVQRPVNWRSGAEQPLRAELERLARQDDVTLVGELIDPPAGLDAVSVAVLREAVRNARKHAEPTSIEVLVTRGAGAFALEVRNDGVPAGAVSKMGLGLRLATMDAVQCGGLVEFGPLPIGRWHVRLTVPEDG